MIKSINAFVTTSAMFAEFAYLEKKNQHHDTGSFTGKQNCGRQGIHTLPQNVTLPWH
jgi:hypothetical protein